MSASARLAHQAGLGWIPLGWVPVWQRNFGVWKKIALPSMLGNLADPMIYMLGLGYGLGALLPTMNGQPYVAFLASGILCASTMNAATFETLYSAFTRMKEQRTWEAILNTPLGLADVLTGELVWAASKALLSGTAILLVIGVMGFAHGTSALFILPVIFLTGLAFAALGLLFTALSPSYDFFMYYFTLFITPMTLISGVFFPVDQLPVWLKLIGQMLPLAHSIALIRPLLAGQCPPHLLFSLISLLAITLTAWMIALILLKRRLMR
ncbi:MAG: ABC transporter permease [Zoogloeaceae bacterium]|jgi:lipooligosaccharide transport system permease protein|nr:ABC transporter permease [Zoogloeaceae bacterium]